MFLLPKEMELYEEGMQKKIFVMDVPDLRGPLVVGSDGKLWWSRDGDETETGLVTNLLGRKSPKTVHQPDGEKNWYRKVWKRINTIDQISVWELHQKELSDTHEPYGDSE